MSPDLDYRLTPHGRLITRTGVVIGGAYVERPKPMSFDAQAIQAVMLKRIETKPSLWLRLLRWLRGMTA